MERHGQAASSGSKTKAPGSAGGYLGDFHQTVALDEIAYNQIHEMANNIGGTVSSCLRMVIREAYAKREREMAAQQ